MPKFYSSKSNAQKAAKRFDVAQVVEIDGRWAVMTPEEPASGPSPATLGMAAAKRDDELANMGTIEGDKGAPNVFEGGVPIPEEPTTQAASLLMLIKVYVPADRAVCLACQIANVVGNPALVVNPTSGNTVQTVQPGTKAARAVKGERQPRAAGGKRSAAAEAAQRGVLPTPPDFSAPTHKAYRKKLEELTDLVGDRDVAALRAFPINPTGSSSKALDRYRSLAVAALEARPARSAEGKAVAA